MKKPQASVPPPLPLDRDLISDEMVATVNVGDPSSIIAAYKDSIADGLADLASAQMISEESINRAPYGTAQSIVNMVWALQVELGELSNELKVKPWKKEAGQSEYDYDLQQFRNILKESADVVAFFAAMFVAIAYRLRMTPQDFMQELGTEYARVAIENIARHGNTKE